MGDARAKIGEALGAAYDDADVRDVMPSDRYVIFSDQHKGGRDGADDFQRCERGYNAALAYYHRLGYHLIELGDVEELWENEFGEIAAKYSTTLRLAAAFQADGHYTRLWGNHDIAWKDEQLFQKLMGEHGYRDVEPIEAVRLNVVDATSTSVAELFLVHGHQGTGTSDRFWRLSRFGVRHGWRWLQRALNRPWNTPSMDWKLRGEHAGQMAAWAETEGRVLIAGHTHQPVFFESKKEPDVPKDHGASAANPDEDEALRLARAEWGRAEDERLRRQQPLELNSPCYFNTGCCSFGDGDITGLEIRDGEIRLIRWPCEPGTRPEVLARLELSKLHAS